MALPNPKTMKIGTDRIRRASDDRMASDFIVRSPPR